jgi:hypothetical protein
MCTGEGAHARAQDVEHGGVAEVDRGHVKGLEHDLAVLLAHLGRRLRRQRHHQLLPTPTQKKKEIINSNQLK